MRAELVMSTTPRSRESCTMRAELMMSTTAQKRESRLRAPHHASRAGDEHEGARESCTMRAELMMSTTPRGARVVRLRATPVESRADDERETQGRTSRPLGEPHHESRADDERETQERESSA